MNGIIRSIPTALGIVVTLGMTVLPVAAQTAAAPTDGIAACQDHAMQQVRTTNPTAASVLLSAQGALVERYQGRVGLQPLSAIITGVGLLDRGGASLPVRFICLFDEQGQAIFVHLTPEGGQ